MKKLLIALVLLLISLGYSFSCEVSFLKKLQLPGFYCLYWVDTNCDQKCDVGAGYVLDQETGVMFMYTFTCEQLDALEAYHNEQVKKGGV